MQQKELTTVEPPHLPTNTYCLLIGLTQLTPDWLNFNTQYLRPENSLSKYNLCCNGWRIEPGYLVWSGQNLAKNSLTVFDKTELDMTKQFDHSYLAWLNYLVGYGQARLSGQI